MLVTYIVRFLSLPGTDGDWRLRRSKRVKRNYVSAVRTKQALTWSIKRNIPCLVGEAHISRPVKGWPNASKLGLDWVERAGPAWVSESEASAHSMDRGPQPHLKPVTNVCADGVYICCHCSYQIPIQISRGTALEMLKY
jgi:hypothetical protein